jgi:predicted enzyme related to lactoylglutathione lyase
VAGEFAWHELAADDPKAAFAFYQRLFGWVMKREMDMGADGVYHMFGADAHMYGGFMGRRAGSPPSAWNSYVRVTDLDASIAAVTRGGGRIVMGPHEVPNNDRVVIAVDDQGTGFSLVGAIRK